MNEYRQTIFCFPCAGSSAASYYRWRPFAPSWLRLEPVELPGRGARISEPFNCSVASLALMLAKEIEAKASGHYALYGHSFGGLLAFECARLLEKSNMSRPTMLIVSACSGPRESERKRLARLSDENSIIAEMKKLGGCPPEIFEHPELLRMVVDTASADFTACAEYSYREGSPLSIPIHVFGGNKDDISADALAAWRNETSAPTSITMFDGGHFFIQEQQGPFLDALFRALGPRR